MKKNLYFTLIALFLSFASFGLTPMVPSSGTFCIGTIHYVSDSPSTGGTWSSSSPTIATIDASTGEVTGVAVGVVTFTYTLSGSSVYGTFTINPAPAAISGPSTLCAGSSITLTDATAGGTWGYSSGIVTVGAASGVVTGVSAGTQTIYYTIGGCSVSTSVTVTGTAVGSISGPSTVCVGSTITLTDSTSGGVWTSSAPAVASVSSGGVVTGVSGGSVTITYTASSTCGTASVTRTITVPTATSAGTISGVSTVMAGSVIALSDATPGGSWTSSDPSVATVSSGGLVTGVTAGTVTITYTVTGCGGTAYTTATITVTAFDGISGTVSFGSGSYSGLVKVYLITYNPSSFDLEAVDSAFYGCSGTSVFYQFTGVATDSYRVKAAIMDSAGGTTTTGYIPTYHTSYFYWYDADVIYHVSGTSNTGENINMMSGTVTTGPGFIGGSVLTGANRGTSGAIPSVGLMMCVVNSTTSQLIATTYTDASGNYSFSNLPVGQTYTIFPDSLNYLTTPYKSITLTTAAPSVTSASFVQHTVSHTILPVNVGVKNVQSSVSSVITFPNPTSGKLNIQWNENATEKGTVTITDITGREIYTATLMMNQGSGTNQVDLSGLTNGLYLISIKTATIDYNNKIQVMQ